MFPFAHHPDAVDYTKQSVDPGGPPGPAGARGKVRISSGNGAGLLRHSGRTRAFARNATHEDMNAFPDGRAPHSGQVGPSPIQQGVSKACLRPSNAMDFDKKEL